MDVKLADITSLSKEIFALNAQLANSPGPASLHNDLIAAIRESIQQLDRDLSYVETFVEDEDDSDLRYAQRLIIRRHREDYKTHNLLYRRAVLRLRDNLQKALIQESLAAEKVIDDESHGTTTGSAVSSKSKSNKIQNASNSVIQASSDVTSELRKTHALMAEELSRSALSQELLDESSATLSKLGDEYYNFGTILNGSKRLLKELENADRVDQWWIWGSFGFFCLVVSYILYKRILSTPVNALIWTGSFVFSRATRKKIVLDRREKAIAMTTADSSIISNKDQLYAQDPEVPEQSGQRDTDQIIDLVVPDLVQEEDQEARLSRAKVTRARDGKEDIDIVHVEL